MITAALVLAGGGLRRRPCRGRIVDPAFTRFSFPPRWHHDVLRTLDYFRSSAAAYDPRIEDPIELVLHKRTADGRWLLQNRHPGATFFEVEAVGQPSRWNTLRALRVLRWHRQNTVQRRLSPGAQNRTDAGANRPTAA